MKWLSFNEFKEFLLKLMIYPELLQEKEAMLLYNLSMMTQVDEVSQDRHIRMGFIEFVELLARLAERLSPVPMEEEFDKWDIVDRQILPLHVKLETFLTYIN
jgi:hypothetical protein